MRIRVQAKPKSKENKVEKLDADKFIISVKEPPVKGRANRAILNLLADYFKIPASRLRIVSGLTSKNKIIELN